MEYVIYAVNFKILDHLRCSVIPIDSDCNTSGPQGFLFSALKTFYLNADFDLQPKKRVQEVWVGQLCISYVSFGLLLLLSCCGSASPKGSFLNIQVRTAHKLSEDNTGVPLSQAPTSPLFPIGKLEKQRKGSRFLQRQKLRISPFKLS